MEVVDVVNEHDQVVGQATKAELYEKLLTHRIVEILLFNMAGELLLQLRSRGMKGYPGFWGPSAGGHVHSGETYENAARREIEEELGVKAAPELIGKHLFKEKVWETGLPINKMISFFIARHEGPFRVEASEVERVNFFSLDEVKEMIKRHESMYPELVFVLKEHFGISV